MAVDIFNSPMISKIQLTKMIKLWATINFFFQLGLVSMFNDKADLSGMLEGNEKLCVSKAVHKAFIEVNEEGAEAAAATGKEN